MIICYNHNVRISFFLRMNAYVNIYRLVVFCQLFTCIVCYIHENVKHYIKYY